MFGANFCKYGYVSVEYVAEIAKNLDQIDKTFLKIY